MQPLLPRDSGARASLAGDAASEPGSRGDLLRCYACVACAISPTALQGYPIAVQQRELLHSLATIIRRGTESFLLARGFRIEGKRQCIVQGCKALLIQDSMHSLIKHTAGT